MPKCQFQKARVGGIVTCVPQIEKCINDERDLFGGNEKQISRLKKTIGLDRRRVVDQNTTAADLCEAAALHLLKASEIELKSIDALVFVTQTPDFPQPCNAAILHGRLKLPSTVAALDVNLGCSGYVYGLWLAHMMVENGGCENVLLLAGDTISRLVSPRDRATAPLFGDGGSATIITRSVSSLSAWFILNTDGGGARNLIVPAGGQRCPKSPATSIESEDDAGNFRTPENLFMDGTEIFNFSITEEPRAVQELVDYSGIDFQTIDYFVFHQANRYILKNIAKRLKIEVEKVPMKTVEQYGNQSSASIPSALCGELGSVLLDGDSKKCLLSGFGVGLSWASCLLTLGDLPICEVIDFSRVN